MLGLLLYLFYTSLGLICGDFVKREFRLSRNTSTAGQCTQASCKVLKSVQFIAFFIHRLLATLLMSSVHLVCHAGRHSRTLDPQRQLQLQLKNYEKKVPLALARSGSFFVTVTKSQIRIVNSTSPEVIPVSGRNARRRNWKNCPCILDHTDC